MRYVKGSGTMITFSTTLKHAWALRLATVMLFAFTLGGCANMRPMAYGPDADAVKDAMKQPIFLATVTVKHPFKTYYLPRLIASASCVATVRPTAT
jgi:hypothetical protein